jgi:D-alanyl-D-alanine dipeptidase
VGEYGQGAQSLTVLERDGQLFVVSPDKAERRLKPATNFARKAAKPVALRLDGALYPRTDIGAERVRQIRAGVKSDIARLRAEAEAASPPTEPPAKARTDLVELIRIDPTIKLDIRYATGNNFMGLPLYDRPMAFLQRPAAEAVGRANKALAAYGYGLMIHDGYRPWSVTKMFWDATMPEAHVFVADPAQGSRHNRGCAVDLTLYDLKTGRAVIMTGRYDEMSPRSYADYKGGTTRQRWLRDLLRRTMEAQGFSVYPEEWWHFDYGRWSDYAIGTASFAQLAAGVK